MVRIKTTHWRKLRRRRGEMSYLVSSACSQSIVLLLTDLIILIWVYSAAGGRHSLIFCLITHWDSLPPADTCPAATPVGPSVLLLLLQTASAAEEGSRWTRVMSTPQCALYCVFDQYIIIKQARLNRKSITIIKNMPDVSSLELLMFTWRRVNNLKPACCQLRWLFRTATNNSLLISLLLSGC